MFKYKINIMKWLEKENIIIENLDKKIIDNIYFINKYLYTYDNFTISNINSGIGDILLHKCSYNNSIIYWNIKHLLDYKPFPDNLLNIKFNIELLYKLFENNKIYIFYNHNVIIKALPISIKNTFLNPYFNIKKTLDFKYIIIHTKLRLRQNEYQLVNLIKKKLEKFFSHIKFPYKVIIMGERVLAENTATRIIPSMTTIYKECLLLKNNNDVIDLTVEELYNTPDMKNFENDIGIIANAEYNIGFGHGGQICINLCFSPKTIYYTSPGLTNFDNINKSNFTIITDIDDFIHHVEQNINLRI